MIPSGPRRIGGQGIAVRDGRCEGTVIALARAMIDGSRTGTGGAATGVATTLGPLTTMEPGADGTGNPPSGIVITASISGDGGWTTAGGGTDRVRACCVAIARYIFADVGTPGREA